MSFIKSLKIRKGKKGQAAIEYFVLFAVITALTIASVGPGLNFLVNVKRTLQGTRLTVGFFGRVASRIINPG